jgi:hypothetical protein
MAKQILRGVWECLCFLAGFFTTCTHQNTNMVEPRLQACWDCGRVRRFSWYTHTPSAWHKAVK